MKIEPTDKLQTLKQPAPAPSKKDAGQGDFTAVFDGKMARSDGPSHGPMQVQSPLATPALQQITGPGGREKAGGLLKGLEQYQRLLADRKATLRQISPVVENLKQQAGDARKMLSRIDDTDPIKAILQETILVITKEVERFNMGVYVAD